MPFTVDDQPFGSLSVTLADNDATLAASIMATAPATLSLSVYGAAPGVPLGGTTGQVLKKNSNADWDTTWGTATATTSWGSITGTLSSQTDLQSALDAKAPLASPTFTGTVTIPGGALISGYANTSGSTVTFSNGVVMNLGLSASIVNIQSAGTLAFLGDGTSQTTAYPGSSGFLLKAGNLSGLADTSVARTNLGLGTMAVETAANYFTGTYINTTFAPLASPALTGNPTAPTPATADNDTSIATTAFVKAQGYLTSAPVTSVAGKTGAVTLSNTDISGLGTMATETATNYLSKAGNLSGLADLPTSRTNLGLGTMAVETASNYLTTATASSTYAPLASPALTGTPTSPTASAGTNTTQIATTAFVQQEVPSASTTASGKVELATNAEAIAGTSTTLVPSISNIPAIISHPELRSLAHITSTAVSGSGAVTSAGTAYGMRQFYLSSLATGRARFIYYLVGADGPPMSRADRTKVDFSKKIWMSGKCTLGYTAGATSYLGDSNTFTRITLGGYATDTTGDMSVRGIGFKKAGGTSSAISLTVHNGTTLTDVATTKTCADGESIDWMIYSDGAGNVTLYINGTQEATTSAGPTSATSAHQCAYREQVEAATTPGVRAILQSAGGWLYIEA